MTAGTAHPRLPGLGLALVGLAPGGSTMVHVPPEQAYGLTDPARVRRWARTRFPKALALPIGKWVRFQQADGRQRRVRFHTGCHLFHNGQALQSESDRTSSSPRERLGRIVDVRGPVVVDTNHRRAGHAVELEVQILRIEALGEGAGTG